MPELQFACHPWHFDEHPDVSRMRSLVSARLDAFVRQHRCYGRAVGMASFKMKQNAGTQ